MVTYSSDGFLPSTSEYTKRKADVKVATPDIIFQEDLKDSGVLADAFFAEIAGTEILASARSLTIDSPLHEGSELIIDSGSRLELDINTNNELPDSQLTDINIKTIFPIDYFNYPNNTPLAKYIDKTLDYIPTQFAAVEDQATLALPGYVEVYVNNLPPEYQLEIEIVHNVFSEDAIIYTGEG